MLSDEPLYFRLDVIQQEFPWNLSSLRFPRVSLRNSRTDGVLGLLWRSSRELDQLSYSIIDENQAHQTDRG
jgi:hypothetical protein